jgi:hypothetical protein
MGAGYRRNYQIGTQSDSNGKFCLPCPPTETISIRCIGFKQKTILASEVIDKKIIELDQDTIMVEEITILAESAYQLLSEAMDSTYKHQMKLFKGLCNRQDKLSLNKSVKRESDAKIIFKVNKKNVDYWLGNLKTESSGKISEQPYLAYPSTIPFNLFSVELPSKEERSGMKCTRISTPDNQIIKVTRAKPTKNFINQANYYVNNKTGRIEAFEYIGDFREKPFKNSNRYHYETKIMVTYNTVGDSCVLGNFNYKIIFSHKKPDPNALWEYFVNMDVFPDENINPLTEIKKLRPLDYLLYKN